MIHKTLFILCLNISLYASDFINVTLSDFVTVVSRTNNINIVIDEDISHKVTFLVSKKLDKNTYFEVLKTLLKNKNMYLSKHQNFYMIKKIKKDSNPKDKRKSYYSIKLKYINFADIKNFLDIYSDTINYQFIKSSKLLLFKSTKKDFDSIVKVISMIDNLPQQLKLKVTILDTNLDKLKESGFDYQASKTDGDTNYFYNLVSYPFTVPSDLPSTKSNKFYAFVKMQNTQGNSKLVSSPILTLSDNKEVNFNVSTNIPYTTGSTTIDSDDSKTTNAINYKDVGLKIKVIPRIYSKNIVYLDLELEVSNIISNKNNTPIISKKYIKQSFYLKSNNIFALTGINQNETIKVSSGIPYLMDIPFLGWLFKYDSKNNTNSNLSIFFEILDPGKKQSNLILKSHFPNVKEKLSSHNQILKEQFGID